MPAETYYRHLLSISQRMLAAGMAQHWEELVLLEQQRRALIEKSPTTTISPPSSLLIELIQQIQRCDAHLSEKIDAWMTDVRILLRDTPHPPKA